MLNKELLMTGITIPVREPHTLITVGRHISSAFGYTTPAYGYYTFKNAGKLSRIPCWGGYGTIKNYTALKTLATESGEGAKTVIEWRNPFDRKSLVVTRLDTGKSVEFVHTSSSTAKLLTEATLFREEDDGREISLIFDPHPTIIWIPIRTNRSRKRVLCRRSSLGGSRC